MQTKPNMIYLMLILTLNYACVEHVTTNIGVDNFQIENNFNADTLRFTSGIRSIFQDSKGRHWFGSLHEGVAVYNGKSFQYFTHDDGLSDNQIHAIQENQQGNIWFDTQNGVSSYDGTRIKNHTKSSTEPLQHSFLNQHNEPAPNKWMKSASDLWFEAGVNDEVLRYDGKNLKYLAFPPHKILNHHDNLFAVTSKSIGANNMIWFGTYAGVFGYNGNDFTIINDETLGLNRAIEPLHIRSVFEDAKGRLWIGNNGIGVLLQDGDSIIKFSEKHHLVHPTSSRKSDQSPPGTMEHIFTISEDSQGNIWFGDRDAGIWKFDGEQMTNYTTSDGMTSDFALSIYEDRNEKLWFGMADGTIYQFNGQVFEKQF